MRPLPILPVAANFPIGQLSLDAWPYSQGINQKRPSAMFKPSYLLLSIASCFLVNTALAVPASAIGPQARAEVRVSNISASPLLEQLNLRGRMSVEQLKAWYDAVVDDCGGPDKPGSLCSGIVMRTTTTSAHFLPWEPTDSQLAKGSVAFSWLRRDNNFGKPFGNQNGLVFPPPQAVPPGKLNNLHVLCTFPINANTNQRPALQGCGPITGYEPTTDTCQALGIATAGQWLDKYPDASNYRVCGWDMRQQPQESAKWFQTAVQTRAGLADAFWQINNEVLLPVWKMGSGAALPIHAFFFVSGEPQALAKAQYDQIRYQREYQQVVPVIGLAFPAAKRGVMSFIYDEAEQAVGRPTPTPAIDFESLDVGETGKVTINDVEFELSTRRRGVSDAPHEGSGGKIRGKHLQADSAIKFALHGAGRRLVSFSWGSNSYSGISLDISGEQIELSADEPDEMRYGRQELIIDGPEVFSIIVDSEEDDSLLVLDNIEVEQLPAL